jgi:hypothetical protein
LANRTRPEHEAHWASIARVDADARLRNLRKVACAAFFVAVVPALASCAKKVELTQEVKLAEPDKKVKVKRTETFAYKLSRLDFNQSYAHSELTVVDSDLPTWKQRLQPIYFGELAGAAGYVVVAVIPDAQGCAERGKPASPYVAYAASKDRWHEIPLPEYLVGRTANLAYIFESYPLENELIVKSINASAPSGC